MAPPTAPPTPSEDSTTTLSSRIRFALLALLPIVVLIAGWAFWQDRSDWPSRLRIATGGEGGTYIRYGTGIARILERELGLPVEVLETAGSRDNVGRLAAGGADLAFVQSNTEGSQAVTLRTVARLYEETVQLVVRTDSDARQLLDLEGAPVAVGAADSGTVLLTQALLGHLGMTVEAHHLSFGDSARALRRGEVEGAFFVAGVKTAAVADLLASGAGRLLPLGAAEISGSRLEGLALGVPGIRASTIPQSTYGRQPPEPVGTVAVDALLVTHRQASPSLVRAATEALFANRFELSGHHPIAARLEEVGGSRGLRFPLHPGAANYYARNDPPFLVTYAETLSLVVTLVLSVGSGVLALRQWLRRRKKNRIDRYYLDLEELSARIRDHRGDEDRLQTLRDRLFSLRRRAFRELVAERVQADESFSIFQDFLSEELREVDRALGLRR